VVAGSNPAARSNFFPRRRPYHPAVEAPRPRDREAIGLDLVGIAGLAAFLVGLTSLQSSEKLGFDPAAAFDGVIGQLGVTLPAALLVLAASALELAAGLVLARAARRTPFDSVAEALIVAMVAAVLKDTLLLGTLAAIGLFRAPVLIAIDVVILGAAWLPQLRPRLHPLTSWAGWRGPIESAGSTTVAAVVAIVWLGPVILQLASPVVPFIDVLPNYVGPVEHLRTFGWFSPLTETQSPIIGPSRTVLGYDGLLGAIATMTGLPGGLAIAGFILPQTVLVGAGAYRLASAIRNGDPPVGAWALLAFALSQSFARLGDARGTVVVAPLVCAGLAIAAELIRDGGAADSYREDRWWIGRGVAIGLALGAATLVHPVIGFFAIVTIAIVALVRPSEAAPDIFAAGVTAGLVALPQLATMAGVSLPTLVLGIWLPIAVSLGMATGRFIATETPRRAVVRFAEIGRTLVPAAGAAILALAFITGTLDANRLPNALGEALAVTAESSGLLLVVLVGGAWLGSRGARSPIVLAGIGIGFIVVVLVQALPSDLGFLGDALRFEVPKTVHYWMSSIAAAGAACALATAWSSASVNVPWAARAAAVAAFVVVAALPLRFGNSGDDADCTQECASINAYHLGEHRWSETFAIDLRYAGIGFWQGFPDARVVVDAPRQELLDALRAEIEQGRLAHDTRVLHVASSFQQWRSTPLGVFDGVDETFVSLDPEVSHQTVGGRLFGLDSLPSFLGSGDFAYVVLEPDGLPGGLRQQIESAGYVSIFANGQGEVLRRAS
jgi:hypothetical protein